jgi:hypothetical protein
VQPLPGVAADFRTLRSTASTLERRTPPPEVWTRVAAAIHESPEQTSWLSWMAPASLALGRTAAVIVAVLATGTWFSWREANDTRRMAATAGISNSVGRVQRRRAGDADADLGHGDRR